VFAIGYSTTYLYAMCSPAVVLFLIMRSMSPGFAPIAFTAGSEALICGSWYGWTLYCVSSCCFSSSVRISCLGTCLCWKMSNAGNAFGRSSILLFLAFCFAACVYLPSLIIIPIGMSWSFIVFASLFIATMPTVASSGMLHMRAFSFSFGMSTR